MSTNEKTRHYTKDPGDRTVGTKVVQLRVELTDEEVDTKTTALVRAVEERRELASAAKTAAKEFATKIADRAARIERLAKDIETQSEERGVECSEIARDRTGSLLVKRDDTGEVIDTRALTAEERQADLPGVGKGKKANARAADAEAK